MANKESQESLFKRLTRLFRSGPVVKQKIRTVDTTIAVPDRTKSSGALLFQKSLSPTYATITSNAYNLSERLMRYQDFTEMEYCLHGSTRIAQLDGYKTIEELSKECELNPEHRFVVYSYDHEQKKIVPAWGKQARQTRVDHAWKVTFDSGKEIIGTANHRLMLRDGSYRTIEDLNVGDSLMPFYRKDLFDVKSEDDSQGYRWVYTSNPNQGWKGWVKEHHLIAEWVLGRELIGEEVVHHINFKKSDNHPYNLQVMSSKDHGRLHAEILNGKKWSPENSEWTKKFANQHAKWMVSNPPTKRSDVTFGRILEVCEEIGFSLKKVSHVLDVDINVIKSRLADCGFNNFETFQSAYENSNVTTITKQRDVTINDLSIDMIKHVISEDDTKTSLSIKLGCTVNVLDKFLWRRLDTSWLGFRESLGYKTNQSLNGGRPKGNNISPVSFQQLCDNYKQGMSRHQLANCVGTTWNTVMIRLSQHGYKKFSDFSSTYANHKVKSIEYYGVIPLYDLTVDGYKNFATDTVISHNTPELAAALDIYADETVATDDKGKILHVYSNNPKVKQLLEDLFYNTLNVEFNLRSWTRNLPVEKNTIIPLLDGRNITIEQLAKEVKEGKESWVYSIQDGTHRTVPGKVSWCDVTRKDSELVRVWLDDGSFVDCTPDHKFTMRDGSSKEAQHLISGESLMPFYRKTSNRNAGSAMDGYELVYDPATNRYVYTHRRVAEILKECELKNGRHLVTHHIDFNKRNNNPINLVRMDEKEHLELHSHHAIRVLLSPEVTAKRMVGINRWLRSDRHRMIAKEQLKKLQDAGLMRKSWSEYNNSEKHTIDNAVRSTSLKKLWNSRREELEDKIRIKFDEKCIDIIVNKLEKIGKYISPIVLGKSLCLDSEFMNHFQEINMGSSRDLTKSLSSHSSFESLLNKVGISTYLDLIRDRLPSIESTPWFKRAEKKSTLMSGIVPPMREYIGKEKNVYMNHKVDRVEHLTNTSDVYCMEVLGPSGEHDRHRFMVLSNKVDENGVTIQNDSGICLENCKFGDFFLYNDVSPEYGVINAFPIPVNEIEREENYDRADPAAVRFRWVTLGNRILENWEISHFRLMGNDMFLPYGSSIIEPARRIWRQLILIEDAMLVYRVVRAPERRVFYIDVGGMPAEAVGNYVEEQKRALKSSQVIDRQTGRVDLRYNPLSVDEDYFLPVRGGETGTKIETLAGGQNAAAVEDVQYIQKKLFAALKIPKAYLGYDEALSSKATLAQEDIRFSRTIAVIQKTIIAELNKLAMIHLYANGYDSDDLLDFNLRLSNPSTVAQQQKLELWRSRFEIAASGLGEGLTSKQFVRKEILGLNDEDIRNLDSQRYEEKIIETQIENAKPDEEESPEGEGEGGEEDIGDLLGGEEEEKPEEEPEVEEETPENAGEFEESDLDLLTANDEDYFDPAYAQFSARDRKSPVKVNKQLEKSKYNRDRRRTHGASKTHLPDFLKMTSDVKSLKDPHDSQWMRSVISNPMGESTVTRTTPVMSSEMSNILKKMNSKFGTPVQQRQSGILVEDLDLTLTDNSEEEV